jgi:hypothetical protein
MERTIPLWQAFLDNFSRSISDFEIVFSPKEAILSFVFFLVFFFLVFFFRRDLNETLSRVM